MKGYFVSVLLTVDGRWNSGCESLFRQLTGTLTSQFQFWEVLIFETKGAGLDPRLREELRQTIPGLRFLQLAGRMDRDLMDVAGLDQSLGDYVVLMDLFQDPAQDLPPAIDLCARSQSLVYGAYESTQKEPWLMAPLSKVFHAFMGRVLKLQLPRFASRFRVYDRFMVNSILQLTSKQPLIRLYGAALGFPALPYAFKSHLLADVSLWDRLAEGIEIILGSPRPTVRFVGACFFAVSFFLLGGASLLAIFEMWSLALGLGALWVVIAVGATWIWAECLVRLLEQNAGKPVYVIAQEWKSQLPWTMDQHQNVVRDT